MPRNELLRRYRMQQNWRQQDLADKLGTTIISIQRWERGTQQPRSYFLIKLCTLSGLSAQELGFVDETHVQPGHDNITPPRSEYAVPAPLERSRQPQTRLWMMPYARNPHFTGRTELLDHLMQQFATEAAKPSTKEIRRTALTQAHAIKGLGGIGKTQIAVEYAYRAYEQNRYKHLLWIAAANEETIVSSFLSLAAILPGGVIHQETDQQRQVKAILHWLETCEDPWLLLVDNADDLSLIQPYLPLHGNGHILLTTRASAVGQLTVALEVETMGLIEGTQLLLRRAQLFADASDEVIDEAGNLTVALGQFPLALDQAGAYIEETGCSIGEYLRLYQQHRHVLLAKRGKQATGYPDSVVTTWSLSFEQIAQTNAAAVELLQLCAFLTPDQIPEELLQQGSPYWPVALQEAVTDRLSFNQMVQSLLAFSLIKRLPEERMLNIHRLVQVVQMERLSATEQHQWAERLIRAMHRVFPADPANQVETWPQCSRYLEQVQACDLLIQQHHLLLPEAAELLDRAGAYLCRRALYALAEPLFQQALYIWERQAEADSIGRALSLNNLAALFFWQDKVAHAEELYMQALHIREQRLGPEHFEVATSLHDLANLYVMQEKYLLAEPLYARALHIREQQLGSEHPQAAETIQALAGLYRKQDKHTQARPFYERALHIREAQLGPEHLDVAESLNNLAMLYLALPDKYAEAAPLYRRAMRIWEQQLGPENPMVVYPLIGLASYYREQGEYGQAEQCYERALLIREQQLGETHRNLIYPLAGLAHIYLEQGKYTQAESHYQRALCICEQQLGSGHSLTASTLDGLANLYSMQDRYIDAEQLYKRALHSREQKKGSEHSDVAQSLRGLANLYTRQGMYVEAEALYRRALRICEQQLGPDSHETASVLYAFAGLRQAQGQIEESADLYQRAFVIRKHVFGADAPKTEETYTHLHMVLVALGRIE